MNEKWVKNGLILAAIVNIGGVLLFSRAFTNVAINNADPVVMSNFGLLMIMVWGLAYLGAAYVKGNIRWLVAAFALEKLVYIVAWVMWIMTHDLASLYGKDLFAGIFFTVYGFNDLLFFVFFGGVFLRQPRR